MQEEPYTSQVDDAFLWRLEEVADAATEVQLEHQRPRLQAALATLVLMRGQADLDLRDEV